MWINWFCGCENEFTQTSQKEQICKNTAARNTNFATKKKIATDVNAYVSWRIAIDHNMPSVATWSSALALYRLSIMLKQSNEVGGDGPGIH